jgi:hypothetical protein
LEKDLVPDEVSPLPRGEPLNIPTIVANEPTDAAVDPREHESAFTFATELQEHVKSTPAFVDTKHEPKKQPDIEPVKLVEVDRKELVRSIIFPTYFLL